METAREGSSDMGAATIFRGGVPYGPDVKRLTEAFPHQTLTDDRVITHGDLEKVLGLDRGTSRYYGVVDAWKRGQKRFHQIYMAWEPKVGMRVLPPLGVWRHNSKRRDRGLRTTIRGISDYNYVQSYRLDQEQQVRFAHEYKVNSLLYGDIKRAKNELALPPQTIASLPRPAAIKSDSSCNICGGKGKLGPGSCPACGGSGKVQ